MKMKKFKMKNVFSFHGEPYMNGVGNIYREDKKNLYTMSPDAYIAKSAFILDMSVDQVINTRLNDKTSYRYIEEAAKNGTLTIPLLDYKRKSQDGLHRAMWAKSIGMKQIPVFIFK